MILSRKAQYGRPVFLILAFLIGTILIFGCFYIIKAGERGVILTLGKLSEDAKEPGLHFKMPFLQKVVKMDVRTQRYDADASAASKDLQVVTGKIAVNYHLVPESTPRIYEKLKLDYQTKIIQPLEQEVVKSVTAKFTAEELITKREEVRLHIKDALYERLVPRGIIVEEVSIVNFDFSKSFNEAIEQKVTAEQLKLKAERDLERIKIEKEQTITQAQAQAEALRLQKQEVTDQLVKLREIEVQSKALDVQSKAIEKWNGILPTTTGGAVPFINVNPTQPDSNII